MAEYRIVQHHYNAKLFVVQEFLVEPSAQNPQGLYYDWPDHYYTVNEAFSAIRRHLKIQAGDRILLRVVAHEPDARGGHMAPQSS